MCSKRAGHRNVLNVLIYWGLSHYIHSIENTFKCDTCVHKVSACQWKWMQIQFKHVLKIETTPTLFVAIQIYWCPSTHYKNIFILYWKWKSVNVFCLSVVLHILYVSYIYSVYLRIYLFDCLFLWIWHSSFEYHVLPI